MTENQQRIYRELNLLRIHKNSIGSDRDETSRQMEVLRKELGGFQYAPMPIEAILITNRNPALDKVFIHCDTCKRLLHNSVMNGDKCYSCMRATF
jgi:hypothetical protein